MVRFVLSVAFVTLLTAPFSFAQESSRQDFDDFCKAWQGRWVGDLALNSDDPQFGKGDDVVAGLALCQTIEDGNALLARVYMGEESGTWFVSYDSIAKRIRSTWCTAGGNTNQSILYKATDGWIQEGSGSDGEGKIREFKDHVTVTDEGDTHTWTGSMTLDGEAVKVNPNVWQRVSKEP
ncbi:hypothetical protein [Novipirellula artificiosorum]|uniref:DUF1579 domain-containing protein n=1 Tax=Novipirellula artificiosorum TaxID=2528016 RepID=A0A5C6CJC4_9BACT|nr:hypothetical protein [Novipirellula artificiosorum]TWU24462.1 hypothetical protein Poly41_70920 [Novipirellula artificiosorum]